MTSPHKTAIVLGASGVLGQAIVKQLIKNTYRVIGTKLPSETASNDIASNDITWIDLDMANQESIASCIEALKKERIDFFTSTIASPLAFKRIEEMPLSTFEKDLQINVLAHITIIQALLPQCNEHSNIVFILSEETIHPTKYLSSYVTSKYAMLGFMHVLANEYAQKKIRVNAISSGMMDTPFIKELPSLLKDTAKAHGKLTNPEMVAKAIIDITNGNKTGENIHVGGA